MMVDSEMGGALLRKKHVTQVDYSTLFYYNLGISILLYLILYICAPLIAKFYEKPPLIEIIRVISLTVVIHAFRVVQRIIIYRNLQFRINAVINLGAGLISLAVAIKLAYEGYGYWALVWQQVVSAICGVVFMEMYTRFIPLLEFSKESFKYQFSFGISLLGSDTIRTIANNISTNIIAKISTLQFTGYYTQTSRLTNFTQSFFGSLLDQSIFPMLAKIGDNEQVRKLYYKILKYICGILLGITLFLYIGAYRIILIVLGKEWLVATPIFKILVFAILPASIQILCRNIMKTLGSTKKVLYLETVKSAIVIGLLLLASLFDSIYVIWSLVVAQVISCVIWLYYTEKELVHQGKLSD